MNLFHASSDGKLKEFYKKLKITHLNLGDVLINLVLRGLIFPDSGERIIPSHDTLLDCQSQPDVREGAVGWGLGGPFTGKPGAACKQRGLISERVVRFNIDCGDWWCVVTTTTIKAGH